MPQMVSYIPNVEIGKSLAMGWLMVRGGVYKDIG